MMTLVRVRMYLDRPQCKPECYEFVCSANKSEFGIEPPILYMDEVAKNMGLKDGDEYTHSISEIVDNPIYTQLGLLQTRAT